LSNLGYNRRKCGGSRISERYSFAGGFASSGVAVNVKAITVTTGRKGWGPGTGPFIVRHFSPGK
jgi:hypothetical protein